MIWFKIVFIAGFVVAASVAASTARRATSFHGGSLNQLEHEVRGLIVARAALGLVIYGALFSWLFWPARFPWAYLNVPSCMRWVAVGK